MCVLFKCLHYSIHLGLHHLRSHVDEFFIVYKDKSQRQVIQTVQSTRSENVWNTCGSQLRIEWSSNPIMRSYETKHHSVVTLSSDYKSLWSSSPSHSCDAAILARYLPVISLGSGVVPGHGTWPSTSQMHSLRQYFFGPKWAGFEACILAKASACNTSLWRERDE